MIYHFKNKDMETKFYLPINSSSLAHYYNNGCITPSKYIENRLSDLQSRFENYILISTIMGVNDADCFLELAIEKSEFEHALELTKDVFLLETPLPISRVKSIFFSNKEQMQQTIANIELSSAFIPKDIVHVVELFNKIKIKESNHIKKTSFKDYSSELRQFNSLLGGFSLMRISSDEGRNFSENYFQTLAFFNEVIEDELKAANQNLSNKFHDAFIGNDSFKVLFKYLNKQINEFDLEEIAKIEKYRIYRDNLSGIIDLSNLKGATYIVAILNSYGTGEEARRKKIDGLILSNFRSNIKRGKEEVVALCYGLNRGYSKFTHKYILGDKIIDLKFKLDSQLDYYTIESLYQYSFNKKRSGAFPNIDKWCPQIEETNLNINEEYRVLDMVVKAKKRAESVKIKHNVMSDSYLEKLLDSFFIRSSRNFFSSFVKELRNKIYNDTIIEINSKKNEKRVDNLKNRKLLLSNKSFCEEENNKIIIQTLKYSKKNKIDLKKCLEDKGVKMKSLRTKEEIIVKLISLEINNKIDNKLNI